MVKGMDTSDMNVRNRPLAECSHTGYALTGYGRTGKCESHRDDRGSHHICLDLKLEDGSNFCKVTNQQNWCDDQRECHGQNGLCDIGSWCVCQWAFNDLVKKVPCDELKIDCDATSMRALQAYEANPTKYAGALECLRKKCKL